MERTKELNERKASNNEAFLKLEVKKQNQIALNLAMRHVRI
jgi:hypothetical protein